MFAFPFSTDALDWSAARGHDEVVQFLLAHRKEGCTEKALNWSSHGGHSSINSSLTEKATLRVRLPHCSVVSFRRISVTSNSYPFCSFLACCCPLRRSSDMCRTFYACSRSFCFVCPFVWFCFFFSGLVLSSYRGAPRCLLRECYLITSIRGDTFWYILVFVLDPDTTGCHY